jgi:hypothetical protein
MTERGIVETSTVFPSSSTANSQMKKEDDGAGTKTIGSGFAKLKNAELPSTNTIVDSLEKVKTSPVKDQYANQMSATGKKIVSEDMDNVISKAQKLMLEKNANDDFQKMLWHARRATDLTNIDKQVFKSQGGDVKKSLSFSYTSIVNFVKLIFQSGEFRRAGKDLLDILIEILKYNVGDTNAQQLTSAKDDLMEHGKRVLDPNESTRDAVHNVVDVVADTANAVVPNEVQQQWSESRNRQYDEVKNMQESGQSKSQMMRQMFNGRSLSNSDVAQGVKSRVSNMEITEDQKDRLVSRLRDNLKTFQNRPEFQKTLDDLLQGLGSVFESTKMYADSQIGKGKEMLQQSDADTQWNQAIEHATNVVENIFGGKSLSDVISSIRVFAQDVMEDEALLGVFRRWRDMIINILRDPSATSDTQAFKSDARVLIDDTKDVVTGTHRDHAKAILNEVSGFMAGAQEDQTNQEFVDSLRQMFQDVFMDDNGDWTFKKELVDDVMKILPDLADRIGRVPLPKFEHDDKDLYISVDNIVLNCSGVIPDYFNMGIHGEVDLKVPQFTGKMYVTLSNVQVSAQNLDFVFHRKTGWPKLSSRGKTDFSTQGKGITVSLEFVPWIQKDTRGVKLSKCDVNFDKKLNVRVYNTKYDWLWRCLPVKTVATKQLERAISDNIRNMFNRVPDSTNASNDGEVVVVENSTSTTASVTGVTSTKPITKSRASRVFDSLKSVVQA